MPFNLWDKKGFIIRLKLPFLTVILHGIHTNFLDSVFINTQFKKTRKYAILLQLSNQWGSGHLCLGARHSVCLLDSCLPGGASLILKVAFSYYLIIQNSDMLYILLDSLKVSWVILNRVVIEINLLQLGTPFQVVEVINILYIVAFTVQYLQVLKETNIKQVVDVVVRDIQFFQLLKGLNALHFFQFTTS